MCLISVFLSITVQLLSAILLCSLLSAYITAICIYYQPILLYYDIYYQPVVMRFVVRLSLYDIIVSLC